MDQKLLQALNNVGFALESLVEAIASREEAKSSTAEAIKGGNFGKQLESITVELSSIKSDTQQILKNQETIISLSKEKEKEKTQTIEDAGSKDQKESIKKGVGTILLIAGAVLAIGLAFKIVGQVDFLSVISLSLAITILAVAFEKVAQMKDLTLASAAMVSASLVMMSIALVLSSLALSYIQPVSPGQILTGILIGGMFAVVSFSIEKMMSAFEGRSLKEIGYSALFLPLILTSISIAIALSSYALAYVQPIGLAQFFTATLIAVTFVVISHGIRGLMRAFKGMNLKSVAMAALFLPVILPAISLAIAGASYALQLVQPIGLAQFFTSLMIGVLFTVLSFGINKIIKAFDKLNPAQAVAAAFMIPILFTAMSVAIWASSEILSNVVPISLSQFLTAIAIGLTFVILAYALAPIIKVADKMNWTTLIKLPLLFTVMSVAIMASSHILAQMESLSAQQMIQAAILGGTLGVISLLMLPSIKVLGKLGIGELLKGSLAIVLIAGVVMVASHILAIGDYSNYPDLGWIIGVGLSLTTFGIAAAALGLLVFGPQALIFLAGLGAVLGLAGTIVGVSKILSEGEYNNPGMLEWAKATSLLYATFTPIMLILGTAALASAVLSIFGPDPWKMAQSAMLDVADTIVQVSYKLQEGNYSQGPTKEWAEGIAIALGAFSPVYGMLMKNAIFSIFGGGGVGPEEFTEAILTVTDGIITAANKFASPEAQVAFKGGPPEEWARGVGLAIGAFAPVYKVLAENSGWLSSGVSVEDMKSAIMTISQGIVDAAVFFSENTASFDEGKYPSEEWGKGVGAALNAFAPVFKSLSEDTGWFTSGDDVIQDMAKGVRVLSRSLVDAATAFSLSDGIWGSYPDESWAKGVSLSINSYMDIFDELDKRGYSTVSFAANSEILKMGISSMAKVASMLFFNKEYFGVQLDPNFVSNISPNILGFAKLGLILDSMLVSEKIIEKESSGFFGIGSKTTKETVRITKDMGIVSKVTASLINVARVLFNNKEVFSNPMDPNFVRNMSRNIIDFSHLVKYLIMSENEGIWDKIGSMSDSLLGTDPISQIAKRMVILSKGYDALASSLTKLGMAMKTLNITDVRMLGGLTRSLTVPSSDVNISGGRRQSDNNFVNNKKTTSVNTSPNTTTFGSKIGGDASMSEKLDEVIRLLSNIDKSTGSVDSLISQYVGDEDAPKSSPNFE